MLLIVKLKKHYLLINVLYLRLVVLLIIKNPGFIQKKVYLKEPMSLEKIGTALATIRHPDAVDVVVLFGTVLANIVLTGLMFSVLMSRHGRVGLVDVAAGVSSESSRPESDYQR